MATTRRLIGNIKGPKGDTGATGATGAQGPAGQDGAPGVSDYATTEAAGLVRVGDDFNINGSNGTLSIKNAFTRASALAKMVTDEAFATTLGKIAKAVDWVVDNAPNFFNKNTDIVDGFDSALTDKALSANAGKTLKTQLEELTTFSSNITRLDSTGTGLSGFQAFCETVTPGRLQYFRMRSGTPTTAYNYCTGLIFRPYSSRIVAVMFGHTAKDIQILQMTDDVWDTKWTQFNNSGTSETGTMTRLTTQTGTFNQLNCYRRNNVVTVGAQVNDMTGNTVLGNLAYFQLPEGFRPTTQGVYCNAIYREQGSSTSIVGRARIDSNGQVFAFYGSATIAYMFFTATFAV